jgi:hypothetical protein
MPGVADVPRCGEREGLYGYDPAGQAPLADWPVSVDQLVAEERALIERMRSGTFEMMRADEIEIDDPRDE